MGDNNTEFQCHFNWDFIKLEKRTELYIRDRINTIDKELSSQEGLPQEKKRNLPQLHSLRGFLYFQLFLKTDHDWEKNLDEAEKSLKDALEECSNNNVGYKAVIYADLIHLKNKRKENSDDLIKQYEDLPKNLPEELAMKGYAATLFHCYEDAINFYTNAISMVDNPECEWVFGLALAMQHRQKRRKITERNEDIENHLRKAIELDPSYDMARIKLAKELWTYEETKAKKRSEIENLLDEVLEKADNPLTVRMEAATLLRKIDNSKGEVALKKLPPKSRKVLSELGWLYFERFQKNNLESNLNEAIKCFNNIHSDAMPFDLTTLGYFHLEASWYYEGNQSKKHYKKFKESMEEAEKRLIKEQYDLQNNIETCYELSKFYKRQSNSEKEFRYLEDTLQKANEGNDEEKLFELIAVRGAKKRLLAIADLKNHVEKLKLKSWVYKQSGEYDIALNHWRQAMSTISTGGNETPKDMLEKEAILLSKVVDKEMKSNIDCPTLKEFEEKVSGLHDCKTKYILEYELRKIKINLTMTLEDLNIVKEKSVELESYFLKYLTGKDSTKQELFDKIQDVFRESKVMLDFSVTYIKKNLFPKEKRQKVNYPRPSEMKNKTDEDKRKILKNHFTSDFNEDYPVISKFLVERLDVEKYSFLEGLFDVRNTASHQPRGPRTEKLNEHFPDLIDKIKISRESADYAADVFQFIKYEVDKAIKNRGTTE